MFVVCISKVLQSCAIAVEAQGREPEESPRKVPADPLVVDVGALLVPDVRQSSRSYHGPSMAVIGGFDNEVFGSSKKYAKG